MTNTESPEATSEASSTQDATAADSFSARVVEGAHPPAGFGLSEERAALWAFDRVMWSPRTVLVTASTGEIVAAALTAGRARTTYRKIVDAVAADMRAFRAVVEAAVADTTPNSGPNVPAPIVVHFEEHPVVAPLTSAEAAELEDLGFQQAETPVPSVPSTVEGSATHSRAWSKWHGENAPQPVPYYGQTTDVTCGAVASLMSLENAGHAHFGADGAENHARELEFWRRATNLPACEPIGLAVTTAQQITSEGLSLTQPRTIISTGDFVLVEDFDAQPEEVKLREQLQRESRRQAERLGLPIEQRWISAEEIRDTVAAGAHVYLLISLDPLIGDPTPHWVVAYAVTDSCVVIADPWVEDLQGESWVDTFAQPLPLETVDLITRWGDPEFRAVVVVSPNN